MITKPAKTTKIRIKLFRLINNIGVPAQTKIKNVEKRAVSFLMVVWCFIFYWLLYLYKLFSSMHLINIEEKIKEYFCYLSIVLILIYS